MLFDAATVNSYRRYGQSFVGELVFDSDPEERKSKCNIEQTNYIGYSFGSLLAAHTAMYYAERGRVIDNVVLIASPINKDFLNRLKNHKNIKNVIVKNLTDVGDPIYAGMTQFELVQGVPNLAGDIAEDGVGHFYYSTHDKKGRQRRLKLALELYKKGIR